MNFFRSEENVRGWADFDPKTERQILPVAEWAEIFSAPICTRRLDPDFVEKSGGYFEDLATALAQRLGWA